MNENRGGGGLFNGALGQLKGPLAAEEPQGAKFSPLERKFYPAPSFVLQNKNKNKINKIK